MSFSSSVKFIARHLCRKSSGDVGHCAGVGRQREISQTTILQKQPMWLKMQTVIYLLLDIRRGMDVNRNDID